MADLFLETAAARVWGPAPPSSFPRDVLEFAPLHLPISHDALPGLTTEAIDAWAEKRNGAFRLACGRRPLRGAIAAMRGQGHLFVEKTDTEAEQRFTAAHEIAHFLGDYLFPRERALAVFGGSILPVLDGERPPTPAQRLDAVLADAPLGVFINLMERDADGQILRGAIVDAEARADRLALHLLAPWEAVRPYLPETVGETQRLAFDPRAQAALQDVFGLPESVAREYAVRLWSRLHRPDTRAWLGL